MKKVKYFIFSLVCLFSCSIVFAKDEVVIKSITPVYDEQSTIVVNNEDNNYGVTFNDKDQSIKYNVVLENTADKDLTIEDISLSKPSQDFLIYELEGLNKNDVLKANSNHEAMVSLSTIKKEGWGRNFNDELFVNVSFTDSVINPNTSTKELIVILVLASFVTGLIIVICRKNKVARYVVLILTISSTLPMVKAQESFILPIKINVSFESQNVMSKSGKDGQKCPEEDACYNEDDWFAFWKHSADIKNIYIVNEIREVNDYAYKYDVSEKQNGRVLAYLLNNESDNSKYDLYLMSDGIIYPNTNASYYFAFMDNLETINNLEGLDTSKVTNMSFMFRSTGSSNPNFTLDVSTLDTSNVTNMSSMFAYTGYSNPNFTLDVSNFDTSNVTGMGGMFSGAGYNNPNFTLDLSNFDTSNVTNMSSMFEYTGYSNPNFTLDVSNFDTSKVVNMSSMFFYTGYKSTKLNTSITIRNANVKGDSYMFSGAATQPGSQITVNYTKDTESLVDQMIAAKPSNSNVIKGVQVD